MITYTCIPVGMLASNCYILNDNGALALVDCGVFTKAVREAVAAQGGDLRYILLSHGHFDHVQGVGSAKTAYPAAQVCIGGEDAEGLKKPVSADQLLEDGDVIRLGESSIRVISTPGHTRGGVCFYCEPGQGTAGGPLFTGDTLFREEVGRDDLPGGDWPTLVASIQRLYELPGDCVVLPGHYGASTLEHERRQNPYVKA